MHYSWAPEDSEAASDDAPAAQFAERGAASEPATGSPQEPCRGSSGGRLTAAVVWESASTPAALEWGGTEDYTTSEDDESAWGGVGVIDASGITWQQDDEPSLESPLYGSRTDHGAAAPSGRGAPDALQLPYQEKNLHTVDWQPPIAFDEGSEDMHNDDGQHGSDHHGGDHGVTAASAEVQPPPFAWIEDAPQLWPDSGEHVSPPLSNQRVVPLAGASTPTSRGGPEGRTLELPTSRDGRPKPAPPWIAASVYYIASQEVLGPLTGLSVAELSNGHSEFRLRNLGKNGVLIAALLKEVMR